MKYKSVHKVNLMKCCRGLCVEHGFANTLLKKKVTPCQAILNQLTTISAWVQLHSLQKAEITHECQPTWQISFFASKVPYLFQRRAK